MAHAVGIGGLRGWIGVVMIAVILGLGYASLLITVLGQWVSQAGSPIGLVLLAAACVLVVLIWLLGAILR
jgi:uncharacterized membrane protein required for colicin V production